MQLLLLLTFCLTALPLRARLIFKYFGWGVAALITPITLLTTGAAFFSLTLFPGKMLFSSVLLCSVFFCSVPHSLCTLLSLYTPSHAISFFFSFFFIFLYLFIYSSGTHLSISTPSVFYILMYLHTFPFKLLLCSVPRFSSPPSP